MPVLLYIYTFVNSFSSHVGKQIYILNLGVNYQFAVPLCSKTINMSEKTVIMVKVGHLFSIWDFTKKIIFERREECKRFKLFYFSQLWSKLHVMDNFLHHSDLIFRLNWKNFEELKIPIHLRLHLPTDGVYNLHVLILEMNIKKLIYLYFLFKRQRLPFTECRKI